MKKSSLSPLFISIAFGSYSQFEYNVSSGTPYGKLNPSAPELGKSSTKKLKSARVSLGLHLMDIANSIY